MKSISILAVVVLGAAGLVGASRPDEKQCGTSKCSSLLKAGPTATPAPKQQCGVKTPTPTAAPKAKQGCCGDKAAKNADAEFMAEAARMTAMAEGKKDACCKSTVAKPVAKGEKGCCNAAGQPANFKVFVAGAGYKFFGCEGSASKGRQELIAEGRRVGGVQKVVAKANRM